MSESWLRRLSDHVGIIPSYLDQTGREERVTSDATRIAILAALGIDGSSDAQCEEAMRAMLAEDAAALLDPVRVVTAEDSTIRVVTVRRPPLATSGGTWSVDLVTEDGARQTAGGAWWGGGEPEISLPTVPPLGYHAVHVTLSADGTEWSGEQTLIVVPPRCVTPEQRLGGDRAFGLIANLYSVRSDRNWGVGDVTDLAELAAWGGTVGAEFVGLNPLHALANRGRDVSPYGPVSRLFRNPIYLDVEAIPELRLTPTLADQIASPEIRAELAELRETTHVRYEQVMAVKGMALAALYKTFASIVRDGGGERARAFKAYVDAHEPELTRFATWLSIDESHGGAWSTQAWPAELRDPESEAVRRFQQRHAPRIDYHRWVQFELDRQLGVAAVQARLAGHRIGLYQDLAIGTSAFGADSWAFPRLFVEDASVGAPPDPYAVDGQNWGLPAVDPRALKRDRYRYWIRLLRGAFRHAGALRIDHVMGLFRLFWIPRGGSGRDGAYVRYPSHDLLGILALESHRHGAIVVGEDLGTVPPEVPPELTRWGILSSKVLYFERREIDGHPAFTPPDEYPVNALATVNTHDLATVAGFWSARDVVLRSEMGLTSSHELGEARQERERDKQALLEALRQARAVAPDFLVHAAHGEISDTVELRAGTHAFLCASPSQLVGVALDDLTGEVEPVNLPGVGLDRFASWQRKMRMTLAELTRSDEVRTALRCPGRGKQRSPVDT